MAVYEQFGLHHNVSFALKQYKDFAAMPEVEWPVLDSVMYSIFPNTQILIGCPSPGSVFVQLFRIYPTGVSGTDVHFTLYATDEVLDAVGRDYVSGAYDLAAGIIEGEDLTAASNAQRAEGVALCADRLQGDIWPQRNCTTELSEEYCQVNRDADLASVPIRSW